MLLAERTIFVLKSHVRRTDTSERWRQHSKVLNTRRFVTAVSGSRYGYTITRTPGLWVLDLFTDLCFGACLFHGLVHLVQTFLSSSHHQNIDRTTSRPVSWSLTSLFSTNTAISETKGQGWKVIRTQWRKASDILTSALDAFLFSSHQKRERDREAHLNYYASAYNRGDNYRITRLKLNQQQHNKHVHP